MKGREKGLRRIMPLHLRHRQTGHLPEAKIFMQLVQTGIRTRHPMHPLRSEWDPHTRGETYRDLS